jgi:hypothetical protein
VSCWDNFRGLLMTKYPEAHSAWTAGMPAPTVGDLSWILGACQHTGGSVSAGINRNGGIGLLVFGRLRIPAAAVKAYRNWPLRGEEVQPEP